MSEFEQVEETNFVVSFKDGEIRFMDVATMQMNRFAIDDHACYGPHKTIFVGTIVKITEEIVTLKVWSRVVRMCIADFCKRNIAFDHEKALEINTWARSSRREFDI